MTATTTGIVTTSPASASLFYLFNPTAGTNDVVVNLGSVSPLSTAFVIWTCSGVNTASPVHDATEATSTGTAVTLTVPNLVAGDVVVDFMMGDADAALAGEPSEGASQTVLHKGTESSEINYGASYQAAADGGVMSWTLGTSDQWAQQAVALTPAASTRRPIPPIIFQ